MSEATIENVTSEVERLCKERGTTDLGILFSDTVQVRDRICRLLEHRQYPRQSTQLYFLASVVCALLANSSVAFGFRRAAVDHARASWTYAELIGHNSLRMHSRQSQAAFAFRAKRPQRALDLALSATQWAAEPIARASLYSSIALYSARTARPDDSRASLETAMSSYDSATGNSELFDHWGGIFSFPRGKMLYSSTNVYLELGDISRAAGTANETIDAYESAPFAVRGYDREAAANIALAHARLLTGDIDGAREALAPVFSLPPQRRLEWVVSRLQEFHDALLNRSIGSSVARQIEQDIEEFTEMTAVDFVPSLSR